MIPTPRPPASAVGPPDPTKTRQIQEWKHGSPLVSCRFDPSGRFIFAGAQDSSVVRWELATGKKTSLVGHRTWVRALAACPREGLLLTGGYDGRVQVWPLEAETPTTQRGWEAHRGWVRAMATSPDGRLLATCGNDHLVRLWSLPDGAAVGELTGHTCHVYSVAFHPEGGRLVSGDLKGVVKVWDVAKRSPIRDLDASVLYRFDPTFQADHGGVRSMAFAPDGRQLACCGITDVTNAFAGIGKPLVVLFDLASGQKQLLRPKEDFQGTAWGVAWHPAGFVTAVGGGNGGAVWYWKPTAGPSFHAHKLPNNGRDFDLHPAGRRLAVACQDGALRLLELGA